MGEIGCIVVMRLVMLMIIVMIIIMTRVGGLSAHGRNWSLFADRRYGGGILMYWTGSVWFGVRNGLMSVIVVRVTTVFMVVFVMTMRAMIVVIMAVIVIMRGFCVMRIVRRVIANLCCIRLRMSVSLSACALDDLALDAFATVAAAGTAMTRTPAAGAVFVFFFGFAVRAFVGLDQSLTVSDRDLVVVWMDFAEGQEAVPVATVFDEGGLQ